jgi:hypothetical protein
MGSIIKLLCIGILISGFPYVVISQVTFPIKVGSNRQTGYRWISTVLLLITRGFDNLQSLGKIA